MVDERDLLSVVLCDLDSTVSDTRHREHLARMDSPSNEAWIPYSQACVSDPIIPGPVAAIKALAQLYPIYFVSGRNVEAYFQTVAWLEKHEIPFTSLRLRTKDDILHNGQYKVAHIRHLRSLGLNPILMFEDHDGVADLVEAEGVPVVRVNPGYVDGVGVNFNHLTEADFPVVEA